MAELESLVKEQREQIETLSTELETVKTDVGESAGRKAGMTPAEKEEGETKGASTDPRKRVEEAFGGR